MNLNLEGKTAVVCGSSQGIGQAIAIELAEMGANIVLFARNAKKLEAVKQSLPTSDNQQHQILVADFNDPSEVNSVICDYVSKGGIANIIINNTGGPPPGPAHIAPIDEYRNAFNQHLINAQQILMAVLPSIKASGYGRIINVISTSVKQPLVGLGVSNSVRGAVANWGKTLATELGQFGITVNNVLPGATNTTRLEAIFKGRAVKQGITPEQAAENEKLHIPAGRFAEAEEFAYAVAFLCSPSASYISGINLPVDGGRTTCL